MHRAPHVALEPGTQHCSANVDPIEAPASSKCSRWARSQPPKSPPTVSSVPTSGNVDRWRASTFRQARPVVVPRGNLLRSGVYRNSGRACATRRVPRRRPPGPRAPPGLGQNGDGGHDDVEPIAAELVERQERLVLQVTSTSPRPRCAKVVVEPRAPESSTGTLRTRLATNAAPSARSPRIAAARTPRRPVVPPGPAGSLRFGMMTRVPGRARSSQSAIRFGVALADRKTTTEV